VEVRAEEIRLPVYEVLELRVRDASMFDRPAANAMLREQIAAIIATEGPVLDRAVFKRVAKAWDKRMGARIVERIAACVPAGTTMTRDGERSFYWPPGVVPGEWRTFRVAGDGDDSRRSPDEVCPEELENIILHASSEHGRCATAALIRIVCGMLGVGRVSAEIEADVHRPIATLVARGLLREESGYVTRV
jgi:hypothetical protein